MTDFAAFACSHGAVNRPSTSQRSVVVSDELVEALRIVVADLLLASELADGGSKETVRLPRPPIQAGEIVSEDRAARALPMRRSDAVAWLRAERLSAPAGSRRVVVWNDVLDRLRPAAAPAERRRLDRGTPTTLLAVPGRILD